MDTNSLTTEAGRSAAITPGKWSAHDIDGRGFYMESSGPCVHLTHAHCKACAFVTVLQQFGGDVDLRGLHRYGVCFGFLQIIVRQIRRGETDSSNTPADPTRGRHDNR